MLSTILNNNAALLLELGFGSSFLLAWVTTPLMKKLALRLGCVSIPRTDRWHSKPIPLFGGLAIFIAFVIPYLYFFRGNPYFWPILGGAVLSVGLGVFDDMHHIKPSSKLIGQIVIACMTFGSGIRLTLDIPPLISIPLTILWIIGMMNALNLLDNMDGLAAGVAAISAFALLAGSYLSGNIPLVLLMSLLIGATLAFLRYNFTPAKIFMGDSGSILLGYLLAVGAILKSDHSISNLMMTLGIPVLTLSVPIFDTTFVTLVRRLHERPISQGGKDHTSHRLVAFGLSERKAVLTLYGVSCLFGGLSVLSRQLNPTIMIVLIGLSVLLLFLFGIFLGEIKVYTGEETLKANGKKKEWIFLNGIIYHKRRIAEVVVDLAIIGLSYLSAFLLRFEGVISPQNQQLILDSLPVLIGLKLLSFFLFGLYRGVWRYVSLNDLVAISKAIVVGQVAAILFFVYSFRFEGYSRSVFIIDGLLSLVLVAGSRVILRVFREFFISLGEQGRRILIMGAGDAGELALREIRNNRRLNYKLIGFIDDDRKKKGTLIHGVPVLGTRHDLMSVAKREGVGEVLIAIPSVSDNQLAEVYETCLKNHILCHRMPYVIFPRESEGENGEEKKDRLPLSHL